MCGGLGITDERQAVEPHAVGDAQRSPSATVDDALETRAELTHEIDDRERANAGHGAVDRRLVARVHVVDSPAADVEREAERGDRLFDGPGRRTRGTLALTDAG